MFGTNENMMLLSPFNYLCIVDAASTIRGADKSLILVVLMTIWLSVYEFLFHKEWIGITIDGAQCKAL